jgi:hypothetical protein
VTSSDTVHLKSGEIVNNIANEKSLKVQISDDEEDEETDLEISNVEVESADVS